MTTSNGSKHDETKVVSLENTGYRLVAISSISVGDRYRKDLGDIDALAQSIAELGLLHPITIDTTHKLVAGKRRLEACKRLGWTEIPAAILNLETKGHQK